MLARRDNAERSQIALPLLTVPSRELTAFDPAPVSHTLRSRANAKPWRWAAGILALCLAPLLLAALGPAWSDGASRDPLSIVAKAYLLPEAVSRESPLEWPTVC